MSTKLKLWILITLFVILSGGAAILGITFEIALAQTENLPSQTLGLPPLRRCVSLGSTGTQYLPGINCREAMVDGYPRNFIVYVPPTVQKSTPVVFMYHGSSGDGFQYLKISGWREKAKREGFVAVFPTGLKYCKRGYSCERDGIRGWVTKWHDYKLIDDHSLNFDVLPPDYPETANWPAADVQFTHIMLDDLLDQANGLDTHPQKVYASGFSAGASFSARLAVEAADRLAAVGYVSGGLVAVNDPANQPPKPTTNIPVYAMFGTNDTGIMESVGWNLEDGEIPLNEEALLAIDGMVNYFIKPHLDGFKHRYNPVTLQPYRLVAFPHAALYRWDSPSKGSNDDYTFMVAVLEGLEHKYPNGCHSKNPNCFVAANLFWHLFQNGPDSVFSLGKAFGE